jgi:PAS domain S-box-containing protein
MKLRDSLSKKLTAMNMLVSGGALLLASSAFFAYDFFTFRANLVANTSIQAQIIGSNSVSPLIFNDAKSAGATLSALRASPHIVYAGVYNSKGDYLASYRRDQGAGAVPLPSGILGAAEFSRFERGSFDLAQAVVFQGMPVGFVYIQSDLGAIDSRLRSYAIILFGILGSSLVAALALSRIFQRSIAHPILRLAETARLVSREKDYLIRAVPTGDHDEVAMLVNAFNEMLHEIQERDSALQESERQFRTLADSIPQLAWMAEPNGNLFWYNERWYEYTGSSPEKMMGWGWESVQNPEILPKVVAAWRESIRTGKPFQMIFPLRGSDGNFRDFLTLATPIRDAGGKIVRWFGTNTDITEQQRSEEALRQTEKLAATGRLAASIAHEINNPLEAVTNLVYLSRLQPNNLQKYLKLADQELDRIAQITKNTLGFYRDTASPSVVNLSEVLGEVVALYSRKIHFKKISLRPEFGEGIEVTGFPGEIRQIFANLLANAIEAMSEGGILRIRVSEQFASGNRNSPGVRITFLDDGSGIAPEKMKKIFEPFYTTKKDVGTGLGLWLTLGLVGKHNGSIRVRSSVRPGRTWTVFSVRLPKAGPTVETVSSGGNLTDRERAESRP